MGIFVDHEGLTVKSRRFCEEWLVNGHNGTQAALKAGYSPHTAARTASENLQKPDIQRYLRRRMKEIFDKVGATQEWRANMLKQATEACLDGRADKDGVVNAKGLVMTIAEMNKMEGIYPVEKQEVKLDVADRVNEKVKEYERDY